MTSQQLQMVGGGAGGGAGGAGGPGQPGYQLRQTRGQSSKPREGMATGMLILYSFVSIFFMTSGAILSLIVRISFHYHWYSFCFYFISVFISAFNTGLTAVGLHLHTYSNFSDLPSLRQGFLLGCYCRLLC